jgi:hypothetical protein
VENGNQQPTNLPINHYDQDDQASSQPSIQTPPQPQASPQPAPQRPFSYPKPKRSKAPLILLILVILLIVGGGVYWFFAVGPGHKKSSKQNTTASSQNTTNNSSQSSSSSEDASGNKTFKSTKLGLEFTYPGSWTVKENTDKSEIIITSPSVSYAKKDGTTTKGVFTLKMRNGLVPDSMKPTIQNAVAVLPSEVIAYTAPTTQQRQYTNISFGGSGTNINFFIVSGSAAFKANDSFGSSIDLQGSVYLFAGGFGTDANDALSFDAVPQADFVNSTSYKQALAIVESLKVT